MTLTFLFDHDDLAEVTRQRPAALTGTVVACDLGIHIALRSAGVRHCTPWDFVGRNDWPAVQAFEARVQDFWARHAHIVCGALDLLGLARYRHVACWSRVAWAAYFVQRALDVVTPKEVVTFVETQGHGLDQPPGPVKMPLLHALVRGMSEQRGMDVTALTRSAGGFEDRAAARADRILPTIDLDVALGERPFVLFTGSDGDLLRQAPLIRVLHERGDAVVQAYRSADEATLASLSSIGHHLWHESQLGAAPILGAADERAIAAGRATFAHAGNGAPEPLRGIFANPRMDVHFDFIFGPYAHRMAEHVQRWRTFLARHRPRLLAASYPTPALHVAVQHGIPSLLLPHGRMAQFDKRWFTCLPECVIGAADARHRRRLIAAGIPAARTRVIGDPGVTPLDVGQATPPPHRPRRRIMVGTNAIAAPAQICNLPETDWAAAVKTFEALGRLAARRTNWEFIIKPHPRYDQLELYAEINRDLPAEHRLHIATERSLSECARAADVVVFVNTRSSGVVETSLCGRPVYLLYPDMIANDLSRWGLEDWPTVADTAALEAELDAVFADKGRYARRAAQTAAAAETFLGADQTPGLDDGLTVVDELSACPVAPPA